MNKLSRISGYGAAMMLVCVMASTACAQLPETDQGKKGRHWEEKFDEIIKELDLTKEQQQAITEQRAQEKARSKALRQQMKSVRDEITLELDKGTTDTAKLGSLVAQLKELTGSRIEQQIQGIISLKKILTPEQFTKLNEKRKQNEKHRGGTK